MNIQSMKDLLREEKYHADSLLGIETEDLGEENLEHNPYSPNDIRINQRIFTIYQIQHMIETGKLFLTPDFQRNLVWDLRRKSLLIESIMLGIPISSFYFQEDYEGNKIVIDGLQRLSTISQFLNNEFALKELQYLNYNGYCYSDLPQKYVNKIEDTQLVAYVLDSTCHELSKFDVFRRVNTGGMPLNSQEIRNSMAADGTRSLLKAMSRSQEFQKATRGRVKDIRMDAQELCLRFITFYTRYDFETGCIRDLGPLAKMMDQAILDLNQMSESNQKLYLAAFRRSMTNCHALLGDKAFSKKSACHIINKPLFTAWSVVMASYHGTSAYLEEARPRIVRLQQSYFDDGPYFSAITSSTTTAQHIILQFEAVKKILEEL
ncbi:MAG: DUF262 domain-containing protein [Lachnospiraceae bacterium]|nr:DUF262 domain-containing protein [Lachnospiraceae bacterium]